MPLIAVTIFSIIALIVLLSACFNYTNLSIARALRRAREIGVRKVVGAKRKQIIVQFLVEAALIALMALVLGIGLFEFIKPGFFELLPRGEQFTLELSAQLIFLFVGFALFAGLMAGVFPATFLSSMKPVQVLKNRLTQKLTKRLTTRKVLTVFQFIISVGFIVATSIVYRQYQYALNKDLGFEQENILNVYLQDVDYQMFENEMSRISEVKSISFSSKILATNSRAFTAAKLEGAQDSLYVSNIYVDENFIQNHGLAILEGDDFPKNLPKEEHGYLVINEQFVKDFQWESNAAAIGQWVFMQDKPNKIIGVVKDFHYTHLEEPIGSFCFRYQPEVCHIANLKIASVDLPATMQKIEQSWQKLDAYQSMHARFLDEEIEATYQFLIDIMKVFGFVAFLAISIACLGLLGMTVYTTETKLKEISIRKVFGASEGQLIFGLSKGFIYLLLIAALIATPLIFLLFDQVVLNNFAYRINIGLMELSSGFLIILILGLLTIGSQTWKAARANPAENLRGA